MKKFSFIIPSLNEEKTLPLLLSSLVKQKVKDFEVLIVDGKSEDNTKEKALKFKDKLDLKFFEHARRKVASQRNFGAKRATGEYFIIVDADYTAEENFLSILAEDIKKSNADVVLPVSLPITKDVFWRVYYQIANGLVPILKFIRQPFALSSAICVRKEIFEKVGGYDEEIFIYEDQYFFRQVVKAGASIICSKAKLYFSARRNEKEGKLKFLYKNLYASLYVMFVGPLKKEVFEYNMGGHAFKEKD